MSTPFEMDIAVMTDLFLNDGIQEIESSRRVTDCDNDCDERGL